MRFDIVLDLLTDWYGLTWSENELMNIAQYVSSVADTDMNSILDALNSQMGDSVEDGELDGLAMEIFEEWEKNCL